MRHFLLIQSAYLDPSLSLSRLQLSEHTCIPALRYQTEKPIVHVVVHPSDPYLSERKALFNSTGCEVRFIERNEWRLYGEDWELPDEHQVVSRIDDDDVIAARFCELTHDVAPKSGNTALIWPTGYVFWRGQAYLLRHPGNQFVSLATRGHNPHETQHHKFSRHWPTRIVSESPGWIWIRHANAATSTIAKYRPKKVNRIDSQAIPINLRAVHRVVEPMGPASGNYLEHRGAIGIAATPSQALALAGSDKVTVHRYGSFYDAIWSELRPRRVLEVGVLHGSSLRAWQSLGAVAVGIDRNPVPGLGVIRCTVPDLTAAVNRLQTEEPFDLLIDDGSHKLADQVAAINALWPFVRSGGIAVVEDLQDDQAAQYFTRAGWTEHDFRQQSGRWDDRIVSLRKS